MRLFSIFLLFFVLWICDCVPATKNAGEKLRMLREKMTQEKLDAYIVPSEDEHQSEYVANYDKRRAWVSGFTGSAGVAVITLNKSALWTDGRYFIRAEQELDQAFWTLMKQGQPDVPDIETWLTEVLSEGAKVGQNPKLTSISDWIARNTTLSNNKLTFTDVDKDLIDMVWTVDRPSKPSNEIAIHDVIYAGRSWQQKVNDTIARINAVAADLYVVTALDEVAWLFNLRGSDIPYNPLFFAYAIINTNDKPQLYIEVSRINNNEKLRNHLEGTVIRPYEAIIGDIKAYSDNNKTIWISPMSSYAIYNAVSNKNKMYTSRASPVRSIKAVKNEVEIRNSRQCQIRDSAARVRHLYWLENQIKQGKRVTEVSSADELEKLQKEDNLFRGLSFDSISAVGAHAADIHFSTSSETDKEITKNEIYLLDAGAQYEDCTSDITRTHHFGTPTKKEILAYTKVLQGSIDLANLVFPATLGKNIDVVTRAELWKSGLDYDHGTGHGIGFYLCVHESPPRTKYTNNDPYDEAFRIGMIQSDEPGYYEPGYFGIRLETDIEVVRANTTYNPNSYLAFYAQTLVPFDKNLIDVKLLENHQIDWLNDYYARIRNEVGSYLKNRNEFELYDYLMKITEPFKPYSTNNATKLSINFFYTILAAYLLKFFF